jgi:hypothetical protein
MHWKTNTVYTLYFWHVWGTSLPGVESKEIAYEFISPDDRGPCNLNTLCML